MDVILKQYFVYVRLSVTAQKQTNLSVEKCKMFDIVTNRRFQNRGSKGPCSCKYTKPSTGKVDLCTITVCLPTWHILQMLLCSQVENGIWNVFWNGHIWPIVIFLVRESKTYRRTSSTLYYVKTFQSIELLVIAWSTLVFLQRKFQDCVPGMMRTLEILKVTALGNS